MYADTDATFRAYVAACAAFPKCPLSANGTMSAAQIEQTILDLMQSLKTDPLVYKGALVDYSLFRGNLLVAMYGSTNFQVFTHTIAGLLKGNLTVLDTLPPTDDPGNADERRYGIACGDKFSRGREAIRPAIKEVQELSRVSGDIAVQYMSQCARWPYEAKERYEGPFEGIKTAHPLLLTQNRYDPVTSMAAAKNMTGMFEGAVLFEQNDFGVSCKLSLRAVCAFADCFWYSILRSLQLRGAPGTSSAGISMKGHCLRLGRCVSRICRRGRPRLGQMSTCKWELLQGGTDRREVLVDSSLKALDL